MHFKYDYSTTIPSVADRFNGISISPAIIEYDKFNLYQDQIPLLGGARGGFMKKTEHFKIIN